MRILLVRPRRRKQAITLGEFMFSEPIGLECVYRVLKDKYEIKILDMMAEKADFGEQLSLYKPDVVGFTSLCIDVYGVMELAREVKLFDKSIVTVVGGTQVYLSPQSFFVDDIDHVMKYATKLNLKELFEYIESGKTVLPIDGVYSRENGFKSSDVNGINDYIIPDRSSTREYRKYYSYFGYKPCAIMQTSRGCSSVCRFCLRWRIEGPCEQDEPIAMVIEQVMDIKENNIMIFDNDFLHSSERLMEFCDMLENLNIKKNFICYGSVRSIVKNQSAVERFANNGLKAVLVGYESFSQSELDKYNKNTTTEDNIKASGILKNVGIACWASFIMHPDWDISDFKSFRKYIKVLSPEISSLVPLTPFPSGLLYDQYKDRLLFGREDYDNWSFSVVVVRPSKMSLKRYYYEVLKSNLYVNLMLNNGYYMVKQFGILTLARIVKGSMKFLITYIKLMHKG